MNEADRDHAAILADLSEIAKLTASTGYASPRRLADFARMTEDTARRRLLRLRVELDRYAIPYRRGADGDLPTVADIDSASTEAPMSRVLVLLCRDADLDLYVPRFKRCRGPGCWKGGRGTLRPARAPREGRARDPERCAFHRDRSKPDGLRWTCADCDKSRSILSRGGNSRGSDRRRAKRKVSRVRAGAIRYRESEGGRTAAKKARETAKRERPELRRCRDWLRQQIERGRIARPAPCSCGGAWRPVYASREPGRRQLRAWACARCKETAREAIDLAGGLYHLG